jgi:hypothetical protein
MALISWSKIVNAILAPDQPLTATTGRQLRDNTQFARKHIFSGNLVMPDSGGINYSVTTELEDTRTWQDKRVRIVFAFWFDDATHTVEFGDAGNFGVTSGGTYDFFAGIFTLDNIDRQGQLTNMVKIQQASVGTPHTDKVQFITSSGLPSDEYEIYLYVNGSGNLELEFYRFGDDNNGAGTFYMNYLMSAEIFDPSDDDNT